MSTASKTTASPSAGITVTDAGKRGSVTVETSRSAPVKVFTDVSIKNGHTGVGVVIKNHNGRILHRRWFLIGGHTGSHDAEAEAIREAMNIINADHAKFYTDCRSVLSWFEDRNLGLPLDEFEYVTLECVDRDENFAAHLLAQRANPAVTV